MCARYVYKERIFFVSSFVMTFWVLFDFAPTIKVAIGR
jgi:hypothetical protein